MLSRVLVRATLAFAWVGVVSVAHAQFTRLDGHRIRVGAGVGVGGTPTVGPYVAASSPENVGVDVAAGVVFPYHLYVGADFRWFAGTRPTARVPMEYRAVRTTVDVGYELGDRLVRARFYVGVGHNQYRLVLDDFEAARSSFVVAPGVSMFIGRDSGPFAGVDFRCAQVIRPNRSQPLAPTDGNVDNSLNFFFVVGWSIAVRAPASTPARTETVETVAPGDVLPR